MEKVDSRFDQLNRIYTLYDRFMAGTKYFCHRGCSVCCTCNVTLTSLEVDHIRWNLGPQGIMTIVDRVKKNLSERRFQPKTTLNGFARACVTGISLPDEENDSRWGTCPLLLNQECTIYAVRPFGCRILVSMDDCALAGVATISPFTLTVNNLFMQCIEHIDSNGTSGNLSDMFLCLPGNKEPGPGVIIGNQEAPVFMVPPEHRQRIQPLLQKMTQILTNK